MRRSQNLLVTSVLQVTLAVFSVLSFTGVTKAQQSPVSQTPRNPPPEGGQIPRQEENKKPEPEVVNERWNLFWQATSIGQYHDTFHAPYEGVNSLENRTERDVSLTSTLYLGLHPFKNTQ